MTAPPNEWRWSAAAERTWRRCRLLLHLAAWIVPRARRPEWRDEWLAEIYHRLLALDRAGLLQIQARRDLLIRTIGALPHALWVRHSEWRLDMLLQDLVYALRVNWKRPAFSLLVIATLGIGVGANSAMFSIVNAVLIRPLPFPQAEQLIYAFGAFKGGNQASISPPEFLDYRAQNRAFSSFAARTPFGTAVLSSGNDPERVTAPWVTANFFSTLGVKPLLGRAFLPEEEEGNSHKVVVLSYGIWQRRFASDQRVIGTTTSIDGQPHTIVGVMPPVLEAVLPDQIWLPVPFHTDETSVRRFHMLRGIGRLRPGVTLAQAQSDLDAVAKRLEALYPESASWHLRLVTYQELIVGNSASLLLLLLGAVALVLLVACGNVASLMLARATSRQSEIAVRTALGASRTHIVRQLLTESVLLGVAAGALGLILSVVLVRGVHAFAADLLPRVAEVHVDATAIAFTMAIALLTGIVFGLVPALHAARQDVAVAMRSVGRSSTSASHALRLRDALVVGQVALSLVLLVGAGLLIRSLWLVQRVEPGFEPRGLLTAQISLPNDRYTTKAATERFWTIFLDRVQAIPGVENVATTSMLPLAGGGDTYYYVDGQPPASDADKRTAQVNVSSDDYFKTMRIPIVEGRALGAADRTLGVDTLGYGTVVISNDMAKRLFPKGGAVGSRLVIDVGMPLRATIVGVAGDVHAFGQVVQAPDILYLSTHQLTRFRDGRFMSLAVRARDGVQVAVPIRDVLRGMEPSVPLANVATMDQLLVNSRATSAFRTRLLAAFAGIALLLAVVGLYAVLAFAVTQRTREIGVRVALGARAREVFALIVRWGMTLVTVGIILGLIGAAAAGRLIQGMLFEVSPLDPLVFVLVIALLALGGLAACVIPARRATRISPMAALREE